MKSSSKQLETPSFLLFFGNILGGIDSNWQRFQGVERMAICFGVKLLVIACQQVIANWFELKVLGHTGCNSDGVPKIRGKFMSSVEQYHADCF